MKKAQKSISLFIIFSFVFTLTSPVFSATGYINCSNITENSIGLRYDFRDGNDVSLFRGSTRINTWATTSGDYDDIRDDIEDLKRKIEDIAKDIEEILDSQDAVATFSRIPDGFRFTREMGYGTRGVDVRYMQIIFNADPQTRVATAGVGSSGQESDIFGNMTKNAVRRFQTKYASEILHPWNIQSPTGYAGMQTIKKLNKILEGKVIITRIPPEHASLLIGMLLDIKKEIDDLRKKIDNLRDRTPDSSGTFTDRNLSPNTIYTYYLRNGRTSTSPQIDSITCKTSEADDGNGNGNGNGSDDITGYVNCSTSTESSIRVNYSFSNGSNVSLFRGSSRLNTWVSSSYSGAYTDSNLSPNTSYTYYLRNGTSTTSPQIDAVFCYTRSDDSSGGFTCGDTVTDERDGITY